MKTIRISDEVYAEIKNRGKMGETFDAVLRKILDIQTPYRPTPTQKMSPKVINDRFIVSFQEGRKKVWNLPDKKDKAAIKRIRREAVAFVKENMGSYGQVEAVTKALTQAGYYLTR